jgi:hypothetical protein
MTPPMRGARVRWRPRAPRPLRWTKSSRGSRPGAPTTAQCQKATVKQGAPSGPPGRPQRERRLPPSRRLLPLGGESLPIGGLSARTSYEGSADVRYGGLPLRCGQSDRAIAPCKLEPRRDARAVFLADPLLHGAYSQLCVRSAWQRPRWPSVARPASEHGSQPRTSLGSHRSV